MGACLEVGIQHRLKHDGPKGIGGSRPSAPTTYSLKQFIDILSFWCHNLSVIKTCTKCHEPKDIESFAIKRDSIRHGHCKDCQNKYTKQHYKLNKDTYKKRARIWNKQRLIELRNLIIKLKSVPCTDCQIQYDYWIMDFDHLDANEKLANVSRLVNGLKPIEIILEEIKKCEVVCANCHRQRTYQRSEGKCNNN